MTRERFVALADAYGGDVARWPAAERDAAVALMTADPEFARAALSDASRLDAALDAWRPLAVSAELRAAVMAQAPRPRDARPAWATWALRAGLGAALAGAGAAGVLVGALGWSGLDAGGDVITAAMTAYEAGDAAAASVGDV